MKNRNYSLIINSVAILKSFAGVLIIILGYAFYTKASEHAIWYLSHFFSDSFYQTGPDVNVDLYNYARDVIQSRKNPGNVFSLCFGASLILNAVLLFLLGRNKRGV